MNNSFYKLIEIISDLENVEINEILNKRTDSGFRCRSITAYIESHPIIIAGVKFNKSDIEEIEKLFNSKR